MLAATKLTFIQNMSFVKIDDGINNFIKDKPIKVSKDAHSDWLIFDYRGLTWTSNGIEYLIEIFPKFDDNENISSWMFCAAIYYDRNGRRYWKNKNFANETTIDFIADNIDFLLLDSYQYINSIKKSEIPFAVKLSK
jgi:hypothetical protein